MRQTGRYAVKILLALCIGIIVGTLLLLAVYLLPTQEMKANARRSTAIYDYEGVYPQLMTGYKMSQLDNCTDATMVLNAIYPGSGNVIDDAMKVYRVEYRDRTPVGSLTDYANDVKKETDTVIYSRYWHGYLVFLKPILLLFDISDIRVINMCLFLGLLIYIVLQMQKKERGKFIPAFLITVLLMNPLAIPLSFQFSTVSYIMLISVICVINKEKWEKEQIVFFFLLIGIATAYFDFLTFPLVGLYFPMIFMLMKEPSWKRALKIVIAGSIMWIVGYAGMWAGKWLIGSVLTGSNFFADVFGRAAEYESMEYGEGKVNSLQVILKNIGVLIKWPFVIGGFGVIVWLGRDILQKVKNCKLEYGWLLPFGLIMAAPFCWYIAAGTHSYIHYWFTYRELCVSIFAFLTLVMTILQEKTKNKEIER